MRYATLTVILSICFFLHTSIVFQRFDNSVCGTVVMPDSGRKLFSRNLEYGKNSRGVLTDDDLQTEALVHPDLNAFAILFPLSFNPDLPPTQNAVITQKSQTFIPHVIAVTVGSKIYILNEDNEYHNVFSRTPRASFNIGRRPPGHMYPQKINKVGLIKLFCDIHEHMSAYVLSLDTPYFARIDENGNYHIEHLPDGEYRLDIFHPEVTKVSTKIMLKEGKEQVINFDLSKYR